MEVPDAEIHTERLDNPKHMTSILRSEIVDLKEALVRIDGDSTQSVDNTTENIKRILDVLQEISDTKMEITHSSFYHSPIYDLLSIGPLTRTEIPLDVLNQLISSGFDINSCDIYNKACLDIAVEKRHYNAIRLLIKHGAISHSEFLRSVVPPIVSLASQPNVPLDLFDLLATPRNLNRCHGILTFLPLHKAVSCRYTATALHLIKLGASVDQHNGYSKLPIEYFVENSTGQINDGLFMALMPSKASHILGVICKILRDKKLDKTNTSLFEMLHQLVQRLHYDKPLKVECYFTGHIPPRVSIHMAINGVNMNHFLWYTFAVCYLWSYNLIFLQHQGNSVTNYMSLSILKH